MIQEKSSADAIAFEKGWNKGYAWGYEMAEHKWRKDAEKWVNLLETMEKKRKIDLLQELITLMGECP